ncbi:hypothetical protein PIROE2DRAFT_17267 [Piromyces sp. E2]|nr:hypothetical protein PIROE2DRAFT_17267 [Piromyces sp. E2]|eukprot:OUM57670.1 hypothetical protein PIROE2DRAFT_17267 [Piromyces sp. E2]
MKFNKLSIFLDSTLCVLANPTNYNNESNELRNNAQCNKDGAKYNGRSTECKFNCYSEPSKACKNALD